MTRRAISRGTRPPGLGGDYDPETIPLRNAATVLILDEQPELRVLMLKRNSRSAFVGNMWVFPGGAVDPQDATPGADALVERLTDGDASGQLGLESSGIAYWVAVLRETFEESGVMLARSRHQSTGTGRADPLSPARRADLQDQVNSGDLDFLDAVRSEDLLLNGSQVHYVARWVTPLGPPRRYDTRFFVTRMPVGQVARLDNDEAVHHEWINAADAIRANRAGQMLMMTPTIGMLLRLASFSSLTEAMASAATARDDMDESVRIRYETEGPDRIAFPADRDYLDSDCTIENGTLRWPAGRAAD